MLKYAPSKKETKWVNLFKYEEKTIKQYLVYIGKSKFNMKKGIKIENLDYRYERHCL